MIILLVENNVTRAFSLAGTFAIVRFRSVPGDPKDITYVLFSLAVGLSCGLGYVAFGVVCAVLLCAGSSPCDWLRPSEQHLHDAEGHPAGEPQLQPSDDILSQYTRSYRLMRVKAAAFGALFEVTYRLEMKRDADCKAMMDAIRIRNGNLTVSLTLREWEPSYSA